MQTNYTLITLFVALATLLVAGCNLDDANPSDNRNLQPDGGETSPDGMTTTPDGDSSSPDGQSPPSNDTCQADYKDLFQIEQPSPTSTPVGLKAAPLPFKIVEGPAIDSDQFPLSGTYEGMLSIGSSVSLECPPSTATPSDISCSTDKAIAIEIPSDGGTPQTVKIALSLPYDSIDWPSTETAVELSNGSGQFLTMSTTSGGDDIFGIGVASPGELETGFARNHGGVEVSLPADGDDRQTAICLATDWCKRVFRLEPLVVDADSSAELGVGQAQTFTSNSTDYRIWHSASASRRGDFEQEASCSDGSPTLVHYAFARTK